MHYAMQLCNFLKKVRNLYQTPIEYYSFLKGAFFSLPFATYHFILVKSTKPWYKLRSPKQKILNCPPKAHNYS